MTTKTSKITLPQSSIINPPSKYIFTQGTIENKNSNFKLYKDLLQKRLQKIKLQTRNTIHNKNHIKERNPYMRNFSKLKSLNKTEPDSSSIEYSNFNNVSSVHNKKIQFNSSYQYKAPFKKQPYKNINMHNRNQQINNHHQIKISSSFQQEQINSNTYHNRFLASSTKNSNSHNKYLNCRDNNNQSCHLYSYIHIMPVNKEVKQYDKFPLFNCGNKNLEINITPIKSNLSVSSSINSNLLRIDEIKDVIRYYNMNNINEENNILFKGNTREHFIQSGRENMFVKYFGFSVNKTNDNKDNGSPIKYKVNNKDQINKNRKQKYVFISLLNLTK